MAAKQLRVYLDGTHIGSVVQSVQGALSFAYDDAYRHRADATPLFLSMSLTASEHRNKIGGAYLDGLLPDSLPARERWGRQYGVSPNNAFALLRHVGRDAAGAVQVLPDGDAAADDTAAGEVDWLTEDDFVHMTRDLAEHSGDWDAGRFSGRWSLAGAQSKMALFRDPTTGRWGIPRDSTPTTHIIKPALPGLDNHDINEVLCQRAASEAGLLAADAELVEAGGLRAAISRRYDRRVSETGRWVWIHQEDLCQALAVRPSSKYQADGGPGVTDVGYLISGLAVVDRALSAERFFKGLALNVLNGGTDAHAKNYSMVLIGPRVQIAPLYDSASAAPDSQPERLVSCMKIGGHRTMLDVTRRDWAKTGRRLGIREIQANDWVDELRDALPPAFERAVKSLPESARENGQRVADRIVDHVEGTWRPD